MEQQYTVALYDIGDRSQAQPDRVVIQSRILPVVGEKLRVPRYIPRIYGGTWGDTIRDRKVKIVCEVTHRRSHTYWRMDVGDIQILHYYVYIANRREREALERLRRLYCDLGGTVGGSVLSLLDFTLYSSSNGEALIAELMEALNAAGFSPGMVLRWYKQQRYPTPEWLRVYIE
jgi:hypothetical protein